MPFAHRAPARDRARPWLSAVAGVALLLAALAGPALAHDGHAQLGDGTGSTHLRDGWVAPRLTRPTGLIRFLVTYRNGDGAAPAFVRVLIDGRPRAMTPRSDGDYRRGVRFAYAARLPAGRHRIRFQARAVDGTTAALGAGWVRVVAKASGGGSSSGDGTSGATGGTSAGAGGGSTGSPSDATGGSSGPDAAIGSDSGVVGAPGAVADAVSGTALPDEVVGVVRSGVAAGDLGRALGAKPLTLPGAPLEPGDLAGPTIGRGAPDGDQSSGGRGSGGDPGAPDASPLLGLGAGPLDGLFRAYPVLVTTSGTVAVWMAFVFFGKRRRDGEPPAPDPVLAAHAAAGPEPVAAASLVPPTTSGLPIPPGVDPTEAGLPRWRRPSLILARKTDPLRSATTAAALTFAGGAIEPVDGAERRRIRYRLVRLLDVPDEVRANEIGILDEGDEVQVIEAVGTYRLVLCPDGQQGWLHRMVLGDVVEADEPIDLVPDGLDEDVLAAFLATRRESA